MTTLSVPISPKLEEVVGMLIKKGYGVNRADVVRKALKLLAEEEAVSSVLKSEQEVKDGKILRGDLKKIAKKI